MTKSINVERAVSTIDYSSWLRRIAHARSVGCVTIALSSSVGISEPCASGSSHLHRANNYNSLLASQKEKQTKVWLDRERESHGLKNKIPHVDAVPFVPAVVAIFKTFFRVAINYYCWKHFPSRLAHYSTFLQFSVQACPIARRQLVKLLTQPSPP
jgi:hypothetical protein